MRLQVYEEQVYETVSFWNNNLMKQQFDETCKLMKQQVDQTGVDETSWLNCK